MDTRIRAGVLAAALVIATGAVAAADEPLPDHPHALVIGAEFDQDGVPVSVVNCVDLAAGQALPNSVQHAHLHWGRAGEAQLQAGHFVVPLAPFPGSPWTDCESLLASVGL